MAISTRLSQLNMAKVLPTGHDDDEDSMDLASICASEYQSFRRLKTKTEEDMDDQVQYMKRAVHHKKQRVSMQEDVSNVRERLAKNNKKFYLEPHCRRMRQWDGVTFCALIFTAIVTPVEVAFTNSGSLKAHEWPIFCVNRLVDLVFLSDLLLQFFVAYPDATGMLVKSRGAIAKRYLRGWFTIDAVSSLPVEVITLFYGNGSKIGFLKSLRLLRLLKLARVIRASRILARWEAAAVFAFSYAEISMYKFFCKLLLYAHWNACIWGMVAHKDITTGWTWMAALEQSQTEHRGQFRCRYPDTDYSGYTDSELSYSSVPDVYTSTDGRYTRRFARACQEITYKHFDKRIVMHKYWAALYFSVYTMTGIGYGDITATRHSEMVVATLIMLSGAVFWAYMIGEFVTLVSHMDVYGNSFRQRMDELNYMMKDKKFPIQLKRRCRMYLLHSRQHSRQVNYRQLEKSMSISLRHEVAAQNNRWILHVWYFKGAQPSFVVELSQHAHSLFYAPMEVVEQALTLCVVNNGIAARKGKIMSKWSVWGHDFMLDNLDLVDMAYTAALSYLEVVGVTRERMTRLIESPNHEVERRLVRRAVVFYTVKAKFMQLGALVQRKRQKSYKFHSSWDSLLTATDDESTVTPTGTSKSLGPATDKYQQRQRYVAAMEAANRSGGKHKPFSYSASTKACLVKSHAATRRSSATSIDVHVNRGSLDDQQLDGDDWTSDDGSPGGGGGDSPFGGTRRPSASALGGNDSEQLQRMSTKLRCVETTLTQQHERVCRIEYDLSLQMKNLTHTVETAMARIHPPHSTSSSSSLDPDHPHSKSDTHLDRHSESGDSDRGRSFSRDAALSRVNSLRRHFTACAVGHSSGNHSSSSHPSSPPPHGST